MEQLAKNYKFDGYSIDSTHISMHADYGRVLGKK